MHIAHRDSMEFPGAMPRYGIFAIAEASLGQFR